MDLRTQLESTLGATYTFERELGGGGMSRVFAAEETRLRRKVVVKVLSPELAVGVSADRFEREIQTVASLQRANIVPVLTVGETGGLPYFTIPFVEGESLRAHVRLTNQESPTGRRARDPRFARQTARVMACGATSSSALNHRIRFGRCRPRKRPFSI